MNLAIQKITRGVLCLALVGLALTFSQVPAFADPIAITDNPAGLSDNPGPEQGDELPPGFLAVEEGLALGLGVGFANSPYKDYGFQWTPLPIISYEGKYAYIRGMTAGLKLLNTNFFELSAFIGYDPTSFDASSSSNWAMKRLKDRQASGVVGMEARVLTPIGMLAANASGDVLGHSNGFSGKASYTYSAEFGDLEIDPSVGILWSTSKYNDYYYGVSDKESRRSRLKSYDAGAGIAPFVNLTAIYSFNDKWSMFLSGQVEFLESSIKDSPMVNKSEVFNVQTGISYSFF
ncbi:MipA/OmpV family protein [Desulfovibrio sp. OttesenSCG-928-G15]|nr:MipA/OmpV family protein [Desulfovibrio sp. OttesenSCG-928-G15]